jgi:hypothetical protein
MTTISMKGGGGRGCPSQSSSSADEYASLNFFLMWVQAKQGNGPGFKHSSGRSRGFAFPNTVFSIILDTNNSMSLEAALDILAKPRL